MTQFEIADEFQRTESRHPHIQAVLDGHTVFMAGIDQGGIAGRFASVKRRGYIVRTRKGIRGGVPGVYVWREDKSSELSEAPR